MINRNPVKAMAFLAVPAALLLMAQPVLANPFEGDEGFGRFDRAEIAQANSSTSREADREAKHEQMIQQLGLNPEQSQKVQGIMRQGREQSQALQQQLRGKRRALMQYLQTPNANETQARGMNTEINDLQKRIGELRLKSWFEMRAQLTPEQRQKMGQMKRPGGGQGQGKQQGGPGGRPGGPKQGKPRFDSPL